VKIRDKVLISAIIFSAVWHIFWLSAFTVVVVPKVKKPVKFSSVSFLGPILDKSTLNVNIKPGERNALEEKYLSSLSVQGSLVSSDDVLYGFSALPDLDGLSAADEEEFTALAVSRIDTGKIEPGRSVN
jgi:hypothetical protein